MGSTTVVDAARRALGPVGAFQPLQITSALPADLQRDAVRRPERAGYRAAWTNEVIGGNEAFVQLAVVPRGHRADGVRHTRRQHLGQATADRAWRRGLAGPGRSRSVRARPRCRLPRPGASVGREFRSPLATMLDYLLRMAAPSQLPTPCPIPESSRRTARRCSRWIHIHLRSGLRAALGA
jgi:hypothetical protein